MRKPHAIEPDTLHYMNAQKFADELAETAPSIAQLELLGIERVANELDSYNIKLRAAPIELSFPHNNELLDLIKQYDVAKLEVGMVAFLAHPISYSSYIHFATIDTDAIIMTIAGEIKVVDGQQHNHDLWFCAINGGSFLDALVLCNRYFVLTMTDEGIYNDEAYGLALAKSIANTAGGSRYEDFYEMLFGF
jgi:hypothetical protein